MGSLRDKSIYVSRPHLEDVSTEELMSLRDKGFAVGWPLLCDFYKGEVRYVYRFEVYDILATREHLPNKAEARELRQVKTGKRREKKPKQNRRQR